LKPGAGCYTALVSGKGKMQGDFNVYALVDELLLDFEPGYTAFVTERLESYVIADDVTLADASGAYGLLSVQGPRAAEVVSALGMDMAMPAKPFELSTIKNDTLGEIYLVNQPRTGTSGCDIFAPTDSLGAIFDKLVFSSRAIGGRVCGWQALETARIEAAIPRFGADMDDTNLVPETGIESRAISYSKGCYIGQEIIARIRTYGQVAKKLCGMILDDTASLPIKGTRLTKDGAEVGYITSAVASPKFGKNIALGYVRKEANQIGSELVWKNSDGVEGKARIVERPFFIKE
jgi:folate-binding protein YgfZ